jgi:cytochrome c biogenesis protein CcmG/thiol:disulfide interchange protein DsbE
MIDSAQTQTTTSSKSGGKGRYIVFGIGVILLIGLFLAFAWQLQTRESTQLQGNMAPQFELTTFEGDQITLSELQGQIVVVNFWASWCVECYDEAPLLEEAYQDFKDQGVVFLGVDYLDTEKEAQVYISQYGITYPNGYDLRSEISETFQLTGVPETFFIDRDGSIHHVQIGPIERPQLYQLLQDLTAGGTS